MGLKLSTPEQEVKIPEYWNVIFLAGEITDGMAVDVSQRLLSIDLINATLDKPEPINLVINSPGGSLTAAWQICDMMDFVDSPIFTVGLGEIASAALIIFMNGTPGHRTLSSRCSVMSHQYSWGAMGKHSDLIAVRKEQNFAAARILKHYKETTGLTETVISKNLLQEHDTWLSPEEAVKYNMADKIIRSKKKVTKDGRKTS